MELPGLDNHLERYLGKGSCLIRAEPLEASTRQAPFRLWVEIDGVERSYVLRPAAKRGEHEYEVLKAMEAVAIPTPRAYGWDPNGEILGTPCLLIDFIEGESLLRHMLAGETWADDLYIDTACALQAVTRDELTPVLHRLGAGETAAGVLEKGNSYFVANPHNATQAAYLKLKATMPELPELRFSNGDLYPDNMIVRERRLVGVIDFETAGFSDPVFEFLLPFFHHPGLRGRGIEERYCRRIGLDPAILGWYHGLEYFDSLHWVLKLGRPYGRHTAESLEHDLRCWLAGQLT
jgi:aminoglycoside phosphotransferase (APT) family kinase protein